MWQHVVLGAACGVLVAAVCWDLLVRFGFLDNDETVDELTVKALPFFYDPCLLGGGASTYTSSTYAETEASTYASARPTAALTPAPTTSADRSTDRRPQTKITPHHLHPCPPPSQCDRFFGFAMGVQFYRQNCGHIILMHIYVHDHEA